MANDIDDEIKQTRLKLERTSAAMTEKLELLEQRLRDTVDKVKLSLDPRYQFARYPWRILGGSIIFGFLLGSMRRLPAAKAIESPRATSKQRKLRAVEDSLSTELAGLKGMAIGAIIKLLVNMVKQSIIRPGEARHSEHSGRNGGGPEDRRFEAGK